MKWEEANLGEMNSEAIRALLEHLGLVLWIRYWQDGGIERRVLKEGEVPNDH